MTIIVKGKYNKATVHSVVAQETALVQIEEMLNQEFMKDTEVHIMPDYHAGKGCVIGTTIRLKDKVVPNLVGVDIGCGVLTIELGDIDIDFKKLDEVIRKNIPSGRDSHAYAPPLNIVLALSDFSPDNFTTKGLNANKIAESLGTLGGGNHFIEVAEDSEGMKYLLIHTGSRHMGVKVAKFHQEIAIANIKKLDTREAVAQLKAEGREKEIASTIKSLKDSYPDIPKELAYLEGEAFDNYIKDMEIAQKFAKYNRREIGISIVNGMDWINHGSFDTVHNYIDIESMILRKGAVSAKKGEPLVIPINMAEGTLLCKGKGNAKWNYSAPHGAGRIKSRTQAKNDITMGEFKESMEDVWSTSVSLHTLDEAPMAYKPMQEIISAITDTVEIVDVLKPLYNFKGVE